ncbi:uncharacterized protein FPRO_07310 [Fusarium proliferatum ET1]|uniref:Uncharacterized protein n=1 Tax=Fusarium proliferatum (strain ET1) TaxID=1227346 RepID=A0A1L7VTP2_FUSPR|nr:uncharacterized protein FPRO_07310 [Fusarium proliferatum ET1]CZR43773.1 uncharacterized protein FPRO_07310 [Fusarium proliferatum ET1]
MRPNTNRGGLRSLGFYKSIKKHKSYKSRTPPQRPPLLLTEWGMVLQLVCQTIIISTISALWHISNTNNGLVTVRDNPDPSFDSEGFHPPPILSSSIVWAAVPAWIMSAYSSLWSAMLDSLKKIYLLLELDKEHQKPLPGVELFMRIWKRRFRHQSPQSQSTPQNKGSTIEKTLLLDYGEWPVINGFRAMRAGHVLLGICLLLRAALWTAGGLTAAIFATTLVPSEMPATLYSMKRFDEYLGWDEGEGTGNSSVTPAFDIVSATVLRSGDNYPWTTDTHSFLPFAPVAKDFRGNYTFDTEAYSANLDCTIATEDDLVKIGGASLDLEEEDDLDSAQIRFGFKHKGCDVKKWFTLTNNTLQYARTWSTNCGLSSGRARFGMFSGIYNATKRFHLSNLTVVTCRPLIYKSNFTLEMSFLNDTVAPKVIKVSETSRQQFWPFFVSSWLRNIPRYSLFDPTIYNDMDTFSRLVIGHASGEPTLDTLPDKEKISNSFNIIFAALFSNFVTLEGYSSAQRREVTGTMSRLRLRLFVVKSAALATVVILAVTFFTTLILVLHLHRNRHITSLYMDLLLGTAILLRNGSSTGLDSYLRRVVSNTSNSSGTYGTNLVEAEKKKHDLKSYAVWVEGTPRTLHITRP